MHSNFLTIFLLNKTQSKYSSFLYHFLSMIEDDKDDDGDDDENKGDLMRVESN